MTVEVTLKREVRPRGEQVIATSGTFVMIAVDEHGRAVAVHDEAGIRLAISA